MITITERAFLPGREDVSLLLKIDGSTIVESELKVIGGPEALASAQEWRARLVGSVQELAVPQGHSPFEILLRELIQKHPFASGNRRTAFIVAKDFVLKNKEKFKIKEDPKQARIMIGIREGYYKDSEIKGWIKYGEIKKFER